MKGRKIGKAVLLALTVLLGLVILIILGSFINHRVRLASEAKRLIPPGQMVEVNGHRMHVYTEGTGDKALVFLAGGGTAAPMLDFKALYTRLSGEYRIAVVERSGYGFSEVGATPRDIDTVLSETRQALALAGVGGPYILCPHSISGLEAIYWAQQYPGEVEAIVGLDMAVPQSYEAIDISPWLIRAVMGVRGFMSGIGIHRFSFDAAAIAAIASGALSDTEQTLYARLYFSRTDTPPMMDEVVSVVANAEKVGSGPQPAVPVLIFSSDGTGTDVETDVWRGCQRRFIDSVADGQIITLDCAHYVHDLEPVRIAEEMGRFIQRLP